MRENLRLVLNQNGFPFYFQVKLTFLSGSVLERNGQTISALPNVTYYAPSVCCALMNILHFV